MTMAKQEHYRSVHGKQPSRAGSMPTAAAPSAFLPLSPSPRPSPVPVPVPLLFLPFPLFPASRAQTSASTYTTSITIIAKPRASGSQAAPSPICPSLEPQSNERGQDCASEAFGQAATASSSASSSANYQPPQYCIQTQTGSCAAGRARTHSVRRPSLPSVLTTPSSTSTSTSCACNARARSTTVYTPTPPACLRRRPALASTGTPPTSPHTYLSSPHHRIAVA
jgi:hypothetical protein